MHAHTRQPKRVRARSGECARLNIAATRQGVEPVTGSGRRIRPGPRIDRDLSVLFEKLFRAAWADSPRARAVVASVECRSSPRFPYSPVLEEEAFRKRSTTSSVNVDGANDSKGG